MSIKPHQLPDELQRQINGMVLGLVDADVARFLIFSPRQGIESAVYGGPRSGLEVMEGEYHRDHWHKDPLHPSLYDDTDTVVVSDSMLMPLDDWKRESIYLEFLKPHGMVHDMDTFFRQSGKIIGVLTLLRSDENSPFTDADVKQMQVVQPFIEYTLSKVFIPQRITERQQLQERFDLTLREVDVMEYALTGLSNKELIKHLKMSLPTLRTHLQKLYKKVGVHSTSEMIAQVLREVDLDSLSSHSQLI